MEESLCMFVCIGKREEGKGQREGSERRKGSREGQRLWRLWIECKRLFANNLGLLRDAGVYCYLMTKEVIECVFP